jgi:nitrate reductase cytochrome c-type subunit
MEDFILLFREQYRQQAGRCLECAQTMPFSIEGYHFEKKAFYCLHCKEAELEQIAVLLKYEAETCSHPN